MVRLDGSRRHRKRVRLSGTAREVEVGDALGKVESLRNVLRLHLDRSQFPPLLFFMACMDAVLSWALIDDGPSSEVLNRYETRKSRYISPGCRSREDPVRKRFLEVLSSIRTLARVHDVCGRSMHAKGPFEALSNM